MRSNTVVHFKYFVVLMLTQILIVNNISLYGGGVAPVYIMLIMMLESSRKGSSVLLLAALSGFIIDLTQGTGGLHMAAATIIAFIRPVSLNLLKRIDKSEEGSITSYRTHGFLWVLFYTLITVTFYISTVSIIDHFSSEISFGMVATVIINSIITTLFILVAYTGFSKAK